MAIVLGLVVVAAVIVGALAIEQATDGDVGLPDTLAGGYRAESDSKLFDSAADGLEEVLDAPVTVRGYVTSDAERQVTITVIDADAGPYAPSGPQADPELLGLERAPSELVREGDAVCQLAWGTIVPEGEDVPAEEPAGVQCQLAADGRTYWLNGRGLSADDAVDILESVSD